MNHVVTQNDSIWQQKSVRKHRWTRNEMSFLLYIATSTTRREMKPTREKRRGEKLHNKGESMGIGEIADVRQWTASFQSSFSSYCTSWGNEPKTEYNYFHSFTRSNFLFIVIRRIYLKQSLILIKSNSHVFLFFFTPVPWTKFTIFRFRISVFVLILVNKKKREDVSSEVSDVRTLKDKSDRDLLSRNSG